MNPFRSILPVMALVAGLAGCSTPATPDAPSGTGENTATVEPPPSNPGTESSGVETPRSGDYGVAISIPQLPIGGNTEPEGPLEQCATPSWLADTFPDGGVTVTGIRIEPPDGFGVGGSCGGVPECASFTFRPGHGQCSVAVTGSGNPHDPQLKLKGGFTCAPGRESSCQELRTRLKPGLVPLEYSAPESSTTETPPSSAESSPSPAGSPSPSG
jgi:hypothetical protein